MLFGTDFGRKLSRRKYQTGHCFVTQKYTSSLIAYIFEMYTVIFSSIYQFFFHPSIFIPIQCLERIQSLFLKV